MLVLIELIAGLSAKGFDSLGDARLKANFTFPPRTLRCWACFNR
jgi:hypothetical protein